MPPSRILRLLLLPSLVFGSRLFAAPGDLDPSFGTGGLVGENLGGPVTAVANAMVIQPDGRIVTAGTGRTVETGEIDFGVTRYLSNGSLDKKFGNVGRALVDFTGTQDVANAVALQPDGKIVVAGTTTSGSGDVDFAVARFNADGSIDTGFGTGGKRVLPLTSGDDLARGMTLQPDGMILIVGGVNEDTNPDTVIVRLTASGTPDPGFGTSGVMTIPVSPTDTDEARAVVVQPDGMILVAGYATDPSTSQDYVLMRLNTDGSPDTNFATLGKATLDFGGSATDIATSLALQPDGMIVVAGLASPGLGNHFGVVRYDTFGALDTAGFGTGGIATVTADFGGGASAVVLTAEGQIVVGGEVFGPPSHIHDFMLARFSSSGTLDPNFGVGGIVETDYFGSDDRLTALAVQSDGKIVAAGNATLPVFAAELARYTAAVVLPPLDPPVLDTTSMRPDGAQFLGFGSPAVDDGVVGGAATVMVEGKKQTFIFSGDGSALAQTGKPDTEGATFTELGDPVFAGEALGFAATVEQPAAEIPRLLRMSFDSRVFAVRPGGRLAALYSQLSIAGGLRRLAAQTSPAPGGGQFAKFNGFGLPRGRLGMLYAALLHRDGATVTPKSDYGIWRERSDASGTDLLLRTGPRFSLARGTSPELESINFMTPVANQTDQRRSFAPDGGIAVSANFANGNSGVVVVAADGSESVPLQSDFAVPDADGNADADVTFVGFSPPATASGGRIALLAALNAAERGLPAPRQAIFTNLDGRMARVIARGDLVPDLNGVRWGTLGQPAMGEKGMIGLIATLTGKGVKPTTRQVIARVEDGKKSIVARLGQQVPGAEAGVVFRKFMSMVVTDTDPGRVVFTATIGGPGVNGTNNMGLWCNSEATGTRQLMRKGGQIKVGPNTLKVRVFEALLAPKKSMGQGRSTDATGFVTAKAKLSDGRIGVLRIALP